MNDIAPPSALAANSRTADGKPADSRSYRLRLIAACAVGNALEMYDFTVYSFFALVIGAAFFPSGSAYGSLLFAVSTFGIGFVMRPLGGLIIGNHADRSGRKAAMTLTITIMIAGTLCLVVAPTHAEAGLYGPLLLVIGRMLQGFALGGEIGAATAMLMEGSDASGRGFRVGWQLGSQGIAALLGALVAAVIHATLSPEAIAHWGWRVPFALGLLIAPAGFYIRSRLEETHTAPAPARSPLSTLLRDHGKVVAQGILTIIGGTVGTYLVVYFMPTYMVRELHLPASLSMLSGCVSGLVCLASSLLGGWLADRRAQRKPLVVASMGFVLVALYPAFRMMLQFPSVPLVLGISAMLAGSLYFGGSVMLLILMELLPAEVRASGLSLIYSVGVTVFGGSCQFVVTWLLARTGNPLAPAFYMMSCGAVTLLAVLSVREQRHA
ncbi:MFS transporter [Paraburkholderia sp. CNPSo 3281]|uniref:MFS transporter n=1 Tax=Paraburkholderia sp. CNPSo 3281 TaxID=2940933 RepID=UPI0020B873C6|nr:MFS transporter [Paraburkholderia sp. CNPSo 3281]MCP3717396.1 MFS transporter [Paraburkholderia sp. CNPSo 3281]